MAQQKSSTIWHRKQMPLRGRAERPALKAADLSGPRAFDLLAGKSLGRTLASRLAARSERAKPARDQGSIIVVLATDAPVDHRQLRRIAARVAAETVRGFAGHVR